MRVEQHTSNTNYTLGGEIVSIKLISSIEEALWADIYKEQLKKASYPIGEHTAKAQQTQCSDFADNAILLFRARAGKHSQILPVTQGTNDVVFYDAHYESLRDDN